jgi:hypothetical protein
MVKLEDVAIRYVSNLSTFSLSYFAGIRAFHSGAFSVIRYGEWVYVRFDL